MQKNFFSKTVTYKIDKYSILELSLDEDDMPIAEIFIFTPINGNSLQGFKLGVLTGHIGFTLKRTYFIPWEDSLNLKMECLREEL